MGNNCCKNRSKHNLESFFRERQIVSGFQQNFTMGSALGRGNFSIVRQVTNVERPLAVKCISLSKIKKNDILLKRQIQLLQQIECQYIVKCFQIYQGNQYVYITLQLCRDGNFKERINKQGKQSETMVKKVALAVLKALEYLHNLGICHRDIKPDNILFDRQNIKLTDLGLARNLNDEKSLSMVGTPYYVSPEMIEGKYECKSDIWSLGVSLYYALTQRMPFVGEDLQNLFSEIKYGRINWEGVSNEAMKFIGQLLCRNKNMRASASQALASEWLYDL